jgi:aminoglycoside phosphotransferase (APT) family kinase protein
MSTLTPGPLLALGRTAEVYAWQEDQVLKLFYAWCSPDSVQHEIEIGRAIAAMALPTPKLVGALEIEGRHGILYERVEGPSMLKQCNSKPWLVFRFARQLADLHAEIHSHNGDGLPPVRPSLRWEIEQVDSLPPTLKAGVLGLLETLPDGNTLCHCDFHPDQVLITATGPVIIDWMTAHQGPPLADLTRTLILLKVGQVPYAGLAMRAIISLWRGLFYRTYIARYFEQHPAATTSDVRAWMVPVAAARLNEHIAGEQEPLLRIIQRAAGAMPPNSRLRP